MNNTTGGRKIIVNKGTVQNGQVSSWNNDLSYFGHENVKLYYENRV